MVKHRQAAGRTDPYLAGRIGQQAIDMIAAAVAIIALVKNAYLVAVEPVEAMLGSQPYETVLILRGGIAAAL